LSESFFSCTIISSEIRAEEHIALPRNSPVPVKCHLLCLCQVVTSIGELVEVCPTQIQSGWRPLFSALETVHSGNKSEVKEYLVGDYSMGKNGCYGAFILRAKFYAIERN
jgi:predicted secreted protein